MKQIFVVAAAALSVSCSSMVSKAQADPVRSFQDGHYGYAVHCDGADNDMGECTKLAQKTCRGPYKIMAQAGPLGHADPGHDNRLMIVECVEKCPIASSEHLCSS